MTVVRGLLVAALMLGVAGCGVPDSGPPVVDGTPRAQAGGQEQQPQRRPLRPQDAADSREAVEYYFQAASTEWSGLVDQVRRFVSTEARGTIRRPGRITVVRLTSISDPEVRDAGREHRITVKGDVVGELTDTGVMLPADGAYRRAFRLRYTEVGNTHAWLVQNPPSGLVLSTEGIAEWYDATPVYYGNQGLTASLVPDVRYLPNSIDRGKQRNLLVDWLLQPASPWLAPVVARTFPTGTQRRGTVYLNNRGDVVVNLSGEVEPYDRKDLLLAQLLWTLRQVPSPGGLQLRIEGRVTKVNGKSIQPRDAYLKYNAVQALPEDEAAYYISEDSEIRPLPVREVQRGLPRVLTAQDGARLNDSVVSAALSRSQELSALVRETGGRQRLWLGRVSGTSGEVSYQPVRDLPGKEMGEPVWVRGATREVLLVPAAGTLYEVDVPELTARKVDLPIGGRVREVSVAPDGFRAALVVGGRLYVAGIQQRNQVAVTNPRLVSDEIEAVDVAWSREGHLVVAGTGPVSPEPLQVSTEAGTLQVSIDGVSVQLLPGPGDAVPDHVASYPGLPRRDRVLVERNGRVYEIFSDTSKAPGGLTTPPAGGRPFFAV